MFIAVILDLPVVLKSKLSWEEQEGRVGVSGMRGGGGRCWK